MQRVDEENYYTEGMGKEEVMSKQTSTQKRAGRRKRVLAFLETYGMGDEFTSQDVANRCNLSSPFSAGRYINPYMEELNLERIGLGKYRRMA
ncbi:MAG: hypothetical protein WCX79_01215 [Candidatus Paceibacterota bacterium]|jgi:hypothetical protein